MTSILEKVLSWIIGPILAWITTLVSQAVQKWRALSTAKTQIEQENQAVLDVTEKAETQEERDHAADETIRRF